MQNSPEARLANPFQKLLIGRAPHNICKCINFFQILKDEDHLHRLGLVRGHCSQLGVIVLCWYQGSPLFFHFLLLLIQCMKKPTVAV